MKNFRDIDFEKYNAVYFIGVGGIGMSALARYFLTLKWSVAGFDKTETKLTKQLESEGLMIHYQDDIALVPQVYKEAAHTLIVYTPAVSTNHSEYQFFATNGFTILKRAQVLGLLTQFSKGLCVAGTHGKTTTSTLLAHILNASPLKCNAFLGGISANFNSNLVSSTDSDFTVIEADEFDRSFLQLSPFASIVTSTDADHLDIYGDEQIMFESFQAYVDLISDEGFLILKNGLKLKPHSKTITYGVEDDQADCSVYNIHFEKHRFLFDVRLRDVKWNAVEFGLPGIHNAENALACIIFAIELGLNEEGIRAALASFKGVKRRFEYYIKSPELVYIDDYAHHPTEIKSLIDSVKLLYPNQKITAIFQPHLFSRTRDFLDGFSEQLSRVDDLLLMPIYPAREEPIEGVTSEALLLKVSSETKGIYTPSEVLEHLIEVNSGVVLTIGAGDIDRLSQPIFELLTKRNAHK